MKIEDLQFLATNLSSLCGLPVRLYKNETKIFFHSTVKLVIDPIKIEIDNILKRNEQIGYYATKDFYYYSYINHQDIKLIIGPSRLATPDDKTLARLALELELTDDIYEFIDGMKRLSPMPLETILQSLCTFNFILNGTKLTIKDIVIDNAVADEFAYNLAHQTKTYEIDEIEKPYANNSYAIEQELCRIVEHGEINELNIWIKNAPATRPGILSKDALRQAKNIFIATITLISRAAIKGKLDIIEALSLSDLYIQKMELLTTVSEISSLQLNMVKDYTERVAKIRGLGNASIFLIDLNKYILSHISEPIKANDISEALYISKSSLFAKIKQDTNMSLSNYILNVKVNEAKSLLKYTDKSMASISVYLGFSSQSHFNHAFKNITKTTPIEYRKSHQ